MYEGLRDISTLNILNMFTKIYKNITNVFFHDMTCVFNLYNDKAETKKRCIPPNSIQLEKCNICFDNLDNV